MRTLVTIGSLTAVALSLPGCSPDRPMPRRATDKQAYCYAYVKGHGVVDIEREYLPRVVACEHHRAAPAALRAQAIAARSYLYYRLDRTGTIGDGQHDQVLTCNRPPGPEHRAAVADTAYQVLTHDNKPVAGFFVAGARPYPRSCRGGRSDPTKTEKYVTYNRGRRGRRVRRSSLGARDPANRGCMSQRGADCLAQSGWDATRILRSYYGEDIEISPTDPRPCQQATEGPRPPPGGTPNYKTAAVALGIALAAGVILWRRRTPAHRKRKPKRRRAG